MLNGHIFSISGAGPHVFAQGGKNLRIEYLEPSNAIHHSLQLLKRIRSYMNKERKKVSRSCVQNKESIVNRKPKSAPQYSISVLFWSSAPL